MNYLDILHVDLGVEEGVRSRPYDDKTGKEILPGQTLVGKITIGCGRNLSANGVYRGEIALMFDNDLATAEAAARKLVPNFDVLSDARKAVVMNMAFNMGLDGLATFVNTLAAIVAGRYDDAARGMLASKWAKQVGARAERLAHSMNDNTWRAP